MLKHPLSFMCHHSCQYTIYYLFSITLYPRVHHQVTMIHIVVLTRQRSVVSSLLSTILNLARNTVRLEIDCSFRKLGFPSGTLGAYKKSTMAKYLAAI